MIEMVNKVQLICDYLEYINGGEEGMNILTSGFNVDNCALLIADIANACLLCKQSHRIGALIVFAVLTEAQSIKYKQKH